MSPTGEAARHRAESLPIGLCYCTQRSLLTASGPVFHTHNCDRNEKTGPNLGTVQRQLRISLILLRLPAGPAARLLQSYPAGAISFCTRPLRTFVPVCLGQMRQSTFQQTPIAFVTQKENVKCCLLGCHRNKEHLHLGFT